MIEMDGIENKFKFGVNVILGVFFVVCKVGVVEKGVFLYCYIVDLVGNFEVILLVLVFNVINGGFYVGNKLVMQEFMIFLVGVVNFREVMCIGVEVYYNLKNVIKEKYGKDVINVGDEGGFVFNILENKEGLELLKIVIGKVGYIDKVVIGMDVVVFEFFRFGKYDLDFKFFDDFSRYILFDQLVDLYKFFIKDYLVVFIEDFFDQDDWGVWQKFIVSVGIQVVGDDFIVINLKRIVKVVNEKFCNCFLFKVNQIGFVIEFFQVCKLVQVNGWGVMVFYCLGEIEDIFIVDLVVGLCIGQIKIGVFC